MNHWTQPHRYNRRQWIAAGAATLVATSRSRSVAGDESAPSSSASLAGEPALAYSEPETTRWKFGLVLQPPVTCTNVFATFPVPRDWDEQKVQLVEQMVEPSRARWDRRTLLESVDQILVSIDQVRAGDRAEVSFTYDVTRHKIGTAIDPLTLVAPDRIDRDLRWFMGNSPEIDASHGRIRRAGRDLALDGIDSAWQRVERIYDFVRDNVQYVEGPIRRASDALKTGRGDCEDMTSLFVAMCRNAGVPSRMVWIPGHCYPEFYLVDASGQGHWFPCQAAGSRHFGEMPETRPVIQKGDRFKVPESRQPVRYVSEFFRCDRKGSKNPNPKFIMQRVS